MRSSRRETGTAGRRDRKSQVYSLQWTGYRVLPRIQDTYMIRPTLLHPTSYQPTPYSPYVTHRRTHRPQTEFRQLAEPLKHRHKTAPKPEPANGSDRRRQGSRNRAHHQDPQKNGQAGEGRTSDVQTEKSSQTGRACQTGRREITTKKNTR